MSGVIVVSLELSDDETVFLCRAATHGVLTGSVYSRDSARLMMRLGLVYEDLYLGTVRRIYRITDQGRSALRAGGYNAGYDINDPFSVTPGPDFDDPPTLGMSAALASAIEAWNPHVWHCTDLMAQSGLMSQRYLWVSRVNTTPYRALRLDFEKVSSGRGAVAVVPVLRQFTAGKAEKEYDVVALPMKLRYDKDLKVLTLAQS